VEFANQADAENAATALDQSDLFERTIKVEIAKDISEREPRQPREPREPREPRKPKQPKEPKAKEEKEGEQNDGQGPAPRRR
jgi:RNA recognition motif-containing protein